jgi:hypothetical protein
MNLIQLTVYSSQFTVHGREFTGDSRLYAPPSGGTYYKNMMLLFTLLGWISGLGHKQKGIQP